MNFPRSILALALMLLFLNSCGNSKEKGPVDSIVSVDTTSVQNNLPALPVSQNIEAKTFVVTDDHGKQNGWGYDLYVDGKRTIHQPIIPSLPGNNAFQSEADALKMGQLAAARMKSSGSFPTMYPHDVDSLGITVSKNIRHYLDSLTSAQSKSANGK